MSNVDIYEIANYCIEQYKNSVANRSNKYGGTEYFAITEDNQVLYSTTPYILKNAVQCILVHKYLYQLHQFLNSSYTIEYVDKLGRTFDSNFGDDHYISVIRISYPDNLVVRFSFEGEVLHEEYVDFQNEIPYIWELYSRVKLVSSRSEKKLLAELFKKDQTILRLEKRVDDFTFINHLLKQERDQYKELLDEIKQLITAKQ